MKKLIIIIIIFGLSGCALSEPFKKIFGTSIEALEKAKPQGAVREYDYKKDICFQKTLIALKDMGAYIHIKDEQKSVIVAMNFRKKEGSKKQDETDTTEIGIFFEKLDLNKTKITIASLSKIMLAGYSQKIFDNIDKELTKE